MAIVSTIPERCKRCYAWVREHASRSWVLAVLGAACAAEIVYFRLGLGIGIVSTHFAYLPIVLGGLWWGKRATWIAVFFSLWIVVLRPLAPTGESLVADVGRGLSFLLVGFSVGAVRDMAEAARRAEEATRRNLEKAQEKLADAERLASMGQLSAGVAHEINNPLGTVLLYCHMLRKELGDDDSRRADLDMIVSEATRCKNIVRGLLDFARQSRVSKAPADMAALVEEVRSLTAPRAKEVRVQVTTNVPERLPSMMIDATQIRQMLVNLVDNAIDAASGGGQVRISARLDDGDGSAVVDVWDNGCGIPAENLSKLFTPFFTTKEMGKGTGLGLAIAYGVVKMHSGDITVQSKEGEGTTFSVSLPLEAEPDDGTADALSAVGAETGASSPDTAEQTHEASSAGIAR